MVLRVGFDFTLLTIGKLACYCLMERDRRVLSQRLRTILLKEEQAEWTPTCLCQFLLLPNRMGTTCRSLNGCYTRNGFTLLLRSTEVEELTAFMGSDKKPCSLSLMEMCLISRGCSLQTQPWERTQFKGGQGRAFLAYSTRSVGAQGTHGEVSQ